MNDGHTSKMILIYTTQAMTNNIFGSLSLQLVIARVAYAHRLLGRGCGRRLAGASLAENPAKEEERKKKERRKKERKK